MKTKGSQFIGNSLFSRLDKEATPDDEMAKFMGEGRAAEKGLDPLAVDPTQMRRGVVVELEHTSDRHVAGKIALDHLAEYKNYYTALDTMEKLLADGIDPREWDPRTR